MRTMDRTERASNFETVSSLLSDAEAKVEEASQMTLYKQQELKALTAQLGRLHIHFTNLAMDERQKATQ